MATKRKAAITECPKCGSACLWYKPDGSVLCTICMTEYPKGADVNAQPSAIHQGDV